MDTGLVSGRLRGFCLAALLGSAAAPAQPVINTVVGSGMILQGVGGPAIAVNLQNPYFLALDSSNNLYVSDRLADTVLKIMPSGILTQFAGNGVFGFSGDGGQAVQATFRHVLGLTFDASGNTYVADGQNDRIREITPG